MAFSTSDIFLSSTSKDVALAEAKRASKLLSDTECRPHGPEGPSLPAQLSPPFIAFPKARLAHPIPKPNPPPVGQLPGVSLPLWEKLVPQRQTGHLCQSCLAIAYVLW